MLFEDEQNHTFNISNWIAERRQWYVMHVYVCVCLSPNTAWEPVLVYLVDRWFGKERPILIQRFEIISTDVDSFSSKAFQGAWSTWTGHAFTNIITRLPSNISGNEYLCYDLNT